VKKGKRSEKVEIPCWLII